MKEQRFWDESKKPYLDEWAALTDLEWPDFHSVRMCAKNRGQLLESITSDRLDGFLSLV